MLLLSSVIYSNRPLFWDELWYFKLVDLFKTSENLLDFLNKVPAAPLHPILHSLLEPITRFSPKGIRLVNVFGLVLLYFGLVAQFKKLNQATPFQTANLLFAIPMVYVISGLGLTEVPALVFLFYGLVLGFPVFSRSKCSSVLDCLSSILGGVLVGFSILGRQPLLVVPLVMFSAFVITGKKITVKLLLFLLGCGLMCSVVFLIWGGLLPKTSPLTGLAKISLWHGIFAFGYTFIIFLLIAPKWFGQLYLKFRIPYLLLSGVVLVSVQLFGDSTIIPLKGVLTGLEPSLVRIVSKVFIAFLIVGAIIFVHSLFLYGISRRKSTFDLFCLLSLVAILSSTVAISEQFSSRYPMQALFFISILLRNKVSFDSRTVVLWSIGAGLGLLVLASYFKS